MHEAHFVDGNLLQRCLGRVHGGTCLAGEPLSAGSFALRGSRGAPWHDGLHSLRGSRTRDAGKAEARHLEGREGGKARRSRRTARTRRQGVGLRGGKGLGDAMRRYGRDEKAGKPGLVTLDGFAPGSRDVFALSARGLEPLTNGSEFYETCHFPEPRRSWKNHGKSWSTFETVTMSLHGKPPKRWPGPCLRPAPTCSLPPPFEVGPYALRQLWSLLGNSLRRTCQDGSRHRRLKVERQVRAYG
jgi:hypothetical protein